MPESARTFLGSRFGADFSGVRMHTDSESARLNREIGAQAFTHGSDIYFGAGKSNFQTDSGLHLLAHELTHTIQQGAVPTFGSTVQRASSIVQRGREGGGATLDEQYRHALRLARENGNWQDAAEKLNGFNHEDIQNRLAELTPDEVRYLHLGALDNPRVGPDAQVALLTRPGVPRASTAPPAASVSTPARVPAKAPAAAVPAPAPAARTVADMSETDKLVEAFKRAKIAQATRDKILSLFTPKALVIAIISFAAVFIASQFTPVGWAADIGIALTAIFVGSALITALDHLVKFADARNATRDEELDQAGEEFAQAVAEIEIDALLLFLTHGVGGPKAGVPYEGPPPRGLVLATPQGGGVVAVAANTITAEEAARLGLKAAGGSSPSLAMMSQSGSGGGSSGPKSQQTPQATPQQSGASGPSAASGGPKGSSKLVEIADAGGKAIGEFDEIHPDRFVEDKSAKGLNVLNPRTGKPQQTAEEWALKQIFEKTVTRIENLTTKATTTRPAKGGSGVLPTLAEIRTIKQIEFKIEAAGSAELQAAIDKQIKALTLKYPGWVFGVTYGP